MAPLQRSLLSMRVKVQRLLSYISPLSNLCGYRPRQIETHECIDLKKQVWSSQRIDTRRGYSSDSSIHVPTTQLDSDEEANKDEHPHSHGDNRGGSVSLGLALALSCALSFHHRHDDGSDPANDFGVHWVADSAYVLP